MAVSPRVKILKNGRKRTRFQAEIYVEGVRVGSKSFPTKAAAYAWEEAELRRYQCGDINPAGRMTFGECLELYVTEGFSLLRKSSQQARESRLRHFEQSPLLNVRMESFRSQAVDEWLLWLRTQPTAQLKTRRSFEQELKLLAAVLHWYREAKDLAFVIPIGKRQRQLSRYKPVIARRPDHYIREADVPRWLDHLNRERPDPVYHRLGLFMVLTGFRLGEAAGLCWDAIETDAGRYVAHVKRTLTWDYKTKAPYFQETAKTDSSLRTVSLPPVLAEMLEDLRPTRASGLVFLNRKGALLSDNAVRANFNAAFRACGLGWSGSHIARHTSATLGLIATRDLPAIQAQLGHSSARQTQMYAKIIALQGNESSHRTAELIGLHAREDHVLRKGEAKKVSGIETV